jgi:hypothetical protein
MFTLMFLFMLIENIGSSVGRVCIGYGLRNQDLIPGGVGGRQIFFPLSLCLVYLSGPWNMQEIFPQEYSGSSIKLTTHLYLVPRLRLCRPSPRPSCTGAQVEAQLRLCL